MGVVLKRDLKLVLAATSSDTRIKSKPLCFLKAIFRGGLKNTYHKTQSVFKRVFKKDPMLVGRVEGVTGVIDTLSCSSMALRMT